jgi:hypothetical protein
MVQNINANFSEVVVKKRTLEWVDIGSRTKVMQSFFVIHEKIRQISRKVFGSNQCVKFSGKK